jgi:lipoprotein signal peptidase
MNLATFGKRGQAVIALGLMFFDLALKQWVPESHTVINQGVFFGLLPSTIWVYIMVMVLILVLMVWYRSTNRKESVALTLIWAGGAANLLDRIITGGVRDFIFYPLLNVYGNAADIYLVLGMLGMIYYTAVKPNEKRLHE